MQLRDRYAYVQRDARPPSRPRVEPILPPSVRGGDSRLGRVYFAEQFWPLEHRHGKYSLDQAFDLDEVARRRLGEELTVDHIRDAAFIDIETTGLSGGTGTYAFLVGVGTFEAFSFRLRQFFLAEPSGERAMLSAIAESVERKAILVSFNGRSFDVPQLATRFALHRLECFEALEHVDLLLAARRLYGRSLDSCRLGAIERSVLGLDRDSDIPSWLIPSLYFSYMHRGQAQALHPVFLHNALDILSLVTFMAHLGLEAGASIIETGEDDHLVALGRWDEAKGRTLQASELYQSVLARDATGVAGGEAASRLARIHRRSGNWQDSEQIWSDEVEKRRHAPAPDHGLHRAREDHRAPSP